MHWPLVFNKLRYKAVEACLTSLPASLLCRLTAARESCPPSSASTISLEIFSPNTALSLQPPQIHPLPPTQLAHHYAIPKTGNAFNFCGNVPACPILESSHPQLSKSPILQFLVSVYITPAALMAWTNDVSFVAARNVKDGKKSVMKAVMVALCTVYAHLLCRNRA